MKMGQTFKGKTNCKWTSTKDYRKNYDQIFGQMERSVCKLCGGKGYITIQNAGFTRIVSCPECGNNSSEWG